jgi:hypothetical protein
VREKTAKKETDSEVLPKDSGGISSFLNDEFGSFKLQRLLHVEVAP